MFGMLLASAALAVAPAPPAPLAVHVGGRTVAEADGWRFGWPGTYFEGRFRGTGVTVVAESATEHMRVLVDGKEKLVLKQPGRAEATLTGLSDGEHVVRLEKLTESQSGGGRFIGFYPAAGASPLPPISRKRAIEFIGDSYTVGYGNTSPTRTCTPQEIHATTDTQQAFGPLLAKRLNADYRVIAYSGFGIVRNYGGGRRGESLPGLYPRLIPGEAAPVERDGGDWRPQIIVVNLGTNDFSTPVKADEPWRNEAALRKAYRQGYVLFARALMARQPQAKLVLMGSDAFIADVQAVAQALGPRARALHFTGLDLGGCDWHPSLADHRALADLLEKTLAERAGS